MADLNKQLANDALYTLQRARFLHPTPALRDLSILRDKIGKGADVESERAGAWLAISALCKTLLETPQGADLEARWQRAIDQTTAWHLALK